MSEDQLDDEIYDDEPLDEAEVAAAIAALREARDAGFGDRGHRPAGSRYRPQRGGYR